MQDLLRILSGAHRWLHQASYFLLLGAACVALWAFRPGPNLPQRSRAKPAERQEEFVLVVEREAGRLSLFCDGSLLAIHPCAVGRGETEQTPCGTYRVEQMLRDEHYRPVFVLGLPRGRAVVEITGGGGQPGVWPPGYVVLEDPDLERLAPFLTPGTRVAIRR